MDNADRLSEPGALKGSTKVEILAAARLAWPVAMKRFSDKRDWVRQHLGDCNSEGQFLSDFAKAFSMKESKASEELKEIMADDRATEEHFADSTSQRLYALGQRLLDEMRAAGAHGPAAQVWKTMQSLKGLDRPQVVDVQVSAAPSAQLVRERIAALMQSQHVQEQAEAVGVDLVKLQHGEQDAIDVGDRMSPAALFARSRSQDADNTEQADLAANPGDEGETRVAPDAGPENIVATHVAARLPR